MVETSTIVSIVYFSSNIILLFLLAYYVKKQGEYQSIASKAFIKDVWTQRKIYVPLVIHFYDTATDIGIVYYWYTLMQKEKEPGIDYQTVDMKVFFWCGLTFLLFYRLVTLLVVIVNACVWRQDNPYEGEWYDVVLVLLDIYIFKLVYNSFKTANDRLAKNAAIRKRNETKEMKV